MSWPSNWIVPLVGLDQPGDHVEHGGLAGAVRPEQSDRLAAPQRQAHALHDLAADEALLDAVDRQRSRSHRRPPRAGAPHAAACRTHVRADARALPPAGRAVRAGECPFPLNASGAHRAAARSAQPSASRNRVPPRGRPAAPRALGAAERDALADREADALRAAVHHRLVDGAEIDAPEFGRRQCCRARRAAKRLQNTEHARLN